MTGHEELVTRACTVFLMNASERAMREGRGGTEYPSGVVTEDMRAAVAAVARALVPEGWAVVPVALVEAAEEIIQEGGSWPYVEGQGLAKARQKMKAAFAAAPSP